MFIMKAQITRKKINFHKTFFVKCQELIAIFYLVKIINNKDHSVVKSVKLLLVLSISYVFRQIKTS